MDRPPVPLSAVKSPPWLRAVREEQRSGGRRRRLRPRAPHEARNDAVEARAAEAVALRPRAELREVLCGLGRHVRLELDHDAAQRGALACATVVRRGSVSRTERPDSEAKRGGGGRRRGCRCALDSEARRTHHSDQGTRPSTQAGCPAQDEALGAAAQRRGACLDRRAEGRLVRRVSFGDRLEVLRLAGGATHGQLRNRRRGWRRSAEAVGAG